MAGVARIAQGFHRHRAGELDEGVIGELETGPLRGENVDRIADRLKQPDIPGGYLDHPEDVRRKGVAADCPRPVLDDKVGELERIAYFVVDLLGNKHRSVADGPEIGWRRLGWRRRVGGIVGGGRYAARFGPYRIRIGLRRSFTAP